jgi:hypothetical protein
VSVDGIYAVSKDSTPAKLTADPSALAVKALNTIDVSSAAPDHYPDEDQAATRAQAIARAVRH